MPARRKFSRARIAPFLLIALSAWAGESAGQSNLEAIYRYSESRVVPLSRIEDGQIVGTGFFVSPQGHILSAYHVVDSKTNTRAELCALLPSASPAQKTPVPVRIIAADASHDLVLLPLQQTQENIDWIEKIGDSQRVIPGNDISFAGFPHGPELTVTSPTLHAGIVSSIKSAVDPENEKFVERLLQIDAAGTQGFSGAPLFLSGTMEVIGVMTAHLGAEKNISFAVPIEYAEPLLQEIQHSLNAA